MEANILGAWYEIIYLTSDWFYCVDEIIVRRRRKLNL